MAKIKLTEKQQVVKLSKLLEEIPKDTLNEFVSAFYQAPFMIPIFNPSFGWLLENGIVREDGFILFSKETVQQAINYEIYRRNTEVVPNSLIMIKLD